MKARGVSVIICCYNSAPRLGPTLDHLARQQTSGAWPWEVIVVNNASTDDTSHVAISTWHQLGRADILLKVVDQPRPGLSFARAKGVEEAGYDVLIFCDDDNWLESSYVQTAFDLLEAHPEVGALGGQGQARADVPLPAWFEQYKGCYACYPQGDSDGELRSTFSFLYGAGLVVRNEALSRLAAKGFHPILPDRIADKLTSGGDTELSYAIRLVGYKLWYSEKLNFYHYLPSNRLTEQYLLRIMSSMSYCSGLLIIYNYLLQGKRVGTFTWFKDANYQLLFFLRALLRYPFRHTSTLEKKQDLAFAANRMRSIFGQAGTYQARYNQILKLSDGTW